MHITCADLRVTQPASAEGCIGPEQVHGFGGFLSMVGTDIILALLINVATGELCKAFAFHIAKFWNFKARPLTEPSALGVFVQLMFQSHHTRIISFQRMMFLRKCGLCACVFFLFQPSNQGISLVHARI